MHQTIQSLWNGQHDPAVHCGVGNREVEKISVLIARNKDALTSTLSPAQLEIFEKYSDCTDEFWNLLTELAFCAGFRLASKLMAEVFSEE